MSFEVRRTLGLALALGALAVSVEERADAAPKAAAGPEGDSTLSRAKELFDAGAREYEAGRFEAAIQAFEQAYKIVPRDGIVFSMAQAHRRQYTKTTDRKHLVRAVQLYKDYVGRVKSGGRVVDALRALGDLESLVGSAPAGPEPTPAEPAKTRIVVNIVVPGTKVSIDGGPPKDPPLNEEVKPGNHTVKLTAPGYFDEERTIPVDEGEIAPANLPQRERPAKVEFKVDSGADVSVDGRFVGQAPLLNAIELPSGPHFVSVSKNGYETFSKEIDLARGSNQKLKADLSSTTQRDASYVVLVSAGVLGIGTIVCAGLALEREAAAVALLETRETRALTNDELENYDDARELRGLYTNIAFGLGGGGAALLILGAGLLVFDKPPPVAAPSLQGPRQDDRTPGDRPPSDIEMTPTVALSPELVAIGLDMRF